MKLRKFFNMVKLGLNLLSLPFGSVAGAGLVSIFSRPTVLDYSAFVAQRHCHPDNIIAWIHGGDDDALSLHSTIHQSANIYKQVNPNIAATYHAEHLVDGNFWRSKFGLISAWLIAMIKMTVSNNFRILKVVIQINLFYWERAIMREMKALVQTLPPLCLLFSYPRQLRSYLWSQRYLDGNYVLGTEPLLCCFSSYGSS